MRPDIDRLVESQRRDLELGAALPHPGEQPVALDHVLHREPREAEHEYGIALTKWNDLPECDAIIAAVSHSEYLEKPFAALTAKLKKGGAFTDVKAAYDPAQVQAAGFTLWRL